MKALMMILSFFVLVTLSTKGLYSQHTSGSELIIVCRTSENMNKRARVRPVGAVFSGDENPDVTPNGIYRLRSQYPRFEVDSIYGGISDTLSNGEIVYVNHDSFNGIGEYSMSVGYGKYLVEFGEFVEIPGINDEFVWVPINGNPKCYVDFLDGNYPFACTSNGYTNDILIFLNYTNGIFYISFSFAGGNEKLLTYIPESDSTIKIWHQLGRTNLQGTPDPVYINCITNERSPSIGKFVSDTQQVAGNFPIEAPSFIRIEGKKYPFGHIYPNELKNVNMDIVRDMQIEQNREFKLSHCTFSLLPSVEMLINENSQFKLLNYSSFKCSESTTLRSVKMANNSSIEVNGGSVNLNNTKFELANGASSWKGITLNNTGLDTIKNCTFSGADTIIRIQNSDKCFARNKKIITGSRFNNGIVRLANVFRALISNDTFATNNSSHYLLTVSNSVHPNDENIFCDEEESPSPMFNLNITCNVIEMKPENQEL